MKRGETLSPRARKLLFFPIQRKFGRHFSLFVSGGAPLSLDVFLFWQNLGFRVVEGYGLTECSPVLAANTMDKQVAGAVGKALPGIEITIEDNEILARGKNITLAITATRRQRGRHSPPMGGFAPVTWGKSRQTAG